MTSIDAVFAHFSQPDGFLAERLGDAMRVLGMNPTEEEDGHGCDFRGGLTFGVFITKTCISLSVGPVCLLCFSVSICNQVRKHLADLGGPQYIEERTFHHFIKDSGFGIGPMFGEVSRCSRRVFGKTRDFSAVSAIFGCSIDLRSTSQDELIKHFEKVQASQMMTAQGPISCVRARKN